MTVQAEDIRLVQEAEKRSDQDLGRELARLLGVVLGEGAEQGACDVEKYARELRGHLHCIASQEPRRLGRGSMSACSGTIEAQ